MIVTTYKKGSQDDKDTNINLFGESEKTLEKLSDGRIFNIEYQTDKKRFIIYERCDEWYSEELTLSDCKNLADLFSQMVEYLKEK